MSDTTLNKPIEDHEQDTAQAPSSASPQDAGMLRQAVRSAEPGLRDQHHEDRRAQLRQAASQLGWQDPKDILRRLANEYGMSWAAIARMVGVSPTAIRKWRKGDPVSPEGREALARLLAFLQYAEGCQPITDIGRWLEMRVASDCRLTPIDLYVMGEADGLLDWLGSHATVSEMLDRVDPDWRSKFARDTQFAVGDGPDGDRAIVQRN